VGLALRRFHCYWLPASCRVGRLIPAARGPRATTSAMSPGTPPPQLGRGEGGGDGLYEQTLCMQHHPYPQLPHRRELSFKEAVLGQGGSDGQGERSVPLTAEVNAPSHVQKPRISEEGWQVLNTKCPRLSKVPQLESEAHRLQERRSLYLRKMKGLCFNCLI
jgi:hypothetical protein